MNKRIFNIVLLVMIVGLLGNFTGVFNSLFKPSTAYAISDLTVNWGVPVGQPIFNMSNLAPGDVRTRVVNVSNEAVTPKPVAVRGILTSQTQNLASVLDIVISDGGTDVYGGTSATGTKTLSQFFTDSALISGIPLSIIDSGENKNYTFKVTFEHSAGNEFQNATIVFDLQIGIGFDVPVACQNINFPKGPIFGTNGNNHISGTNGNDMIVTFDGNDTVSGGNGNDCIISGSGNNNLYGGNGKDVVVSGNGKNKIDGGNGNDEISVGNGNNNVNSGNGADKVSAGDGLNKISGGNGNDVLTTTGVLSNIDGGNGKDVCVANVKKNCEM